MPPQLCLGTVQFGLPYGVTNTSGQVPESEVRSIFRVAAQAGIKWLDTAQAYGASEEVVGRISSDSVGYRLISKLSPQAPSDTWEDNFQKSLTRLQTDRLDGFLLHRSADLIGPDGLRLIQWLENLQARGLVERIGVSIYNSDELNDLPLDRLQIIQLPLSLYDQRLLRDGTVSFLQSKGIGIHARSLFLQGLLLQPATCWPQFLSADFRAHHLNFQKYLDDQGRSFLEGALAFARSCQGLETVLIGVLTAFELEEILEAWESCLSFNTSNFDLWHWDDQISLDPRFWPLR